MSQDTELPTIGKLLAKVLQRANLTPRQFGMKYGFSKATVHRWLHDTGSVNDDLPYRLIVAMAEVANTTPADIFFQLGYNVFAQSSRYTDTDLSRLRLYPLVVNVGENLNLHEAVRVAKSVRAGYWGDGQMKDVLTGYRRAAEYARDAGEINLYIYLMIYVCNLEWMIGNLAGAEAIFEEMYDRALRLQHNAAKSLDYDLEWLGTRLAAHAKLRWLWAKWWAGGVSEESISQGYAMIEELKKCNFYQRIPYVFEFLARCAVSLGWYEKAVEYAEKAHDLAQKLHSEWYARYELFLDAGATGQGGMNYIRQQDHFRETLFDVLIAAGQPERAYQIYGDIRQHRDPQAYLSLHHWFHPIWQEVVANEPSFAESDDPKIGVSYDYWDNAISLSGNLRVQALTAFNQGLYQWSQRDYLQARFCFQHMEILAANCSADDLVGQALAHSIYVAVEENNKPVAIPKANVLQVKMHSIVTPFIREQCRKALQDLAEL